jgi:hypothetical protein
MLRLLAVVGIVSMTLAATATTAFASLPPSGGDAAYWDGTTDCFVKLGPNESDLVFIGGPFVDGAQEVYFPAVGNDNQFGLGPADTSITVQNIDEDDAYMFIFSGGFVDYAYLSAGASKTFTADDLGIEEGKVRPVWVSLYNQLFVNDDGDCVLDPAFAAGVAKQAVDGENLPYTTSADTSVSGYNAISGRELGFFDQLYFPIVQTNCGPGGCWDTMLRIANFGADRNAAVTVRFFPADDGSGSLATGFQLQALVNAGAVWSIDLADWVPQGWVGSAHVFTDDAVAAIADRFKVGTDMWITNTASNAQAESFWQFPFGPSNAPYVLFAPDVRTDWNGWNTGINVANTVDYDNHTWIQYFGSNGNAPLAQDQLLHAQGMTYFYNPSSPSEDDCEQPATDVPGCEFIGGAIILSEAPVAVAVDGVKYFGNDANVGQAFSYAATSNAYTDLSAPLVQKGNPATGMGATSGINFMNPNAVATVVTTTWVNPSGFGASNFADSIVWVPGYSTGFVYTMFHHNLPNGFYGSALVDSTYPILATTANVDYQVQGDGTVVWNLYNPCGFFRFSGAPGDEPDCVYQSPVTPPGASATITKEVICETCTVAEEEVEGALVTYEGVDDAGFAHNGSGLTGALGHVTFAVPPGTYTVTLASLPSTYDQSSVGETDTVTVAEGDAVVITDYVTQATVTKIVDTAVPGITICIYLAGDPIPGDITVNQAGAVACAVADANGDATFTGLEAGVDYVAVVQGMGFDQVQDPFNIGVPGTSETNEIDLGALPGILTKAIDLSGFNIGDPGDEFHLLSEVIFCDADDLTVSDPALIEASGECDSIFDDSAVAHGGFDNFFNSLTPTFEFNAEVAPGDYFICWAATVEGDFDGDPATPDVSISVPPAGSGNLVSCEGPFTVVSGEETFVNNDFVAQTEGTLDVLVEAGDGTTDLEGVEVCVYAYDPNAPNNQGAQIACEDTNADGEADFVLPYGTYAVTARGSEGDAGGAIYEDQTAVVDYNPVEDLALCNVLDDDLAANEDCADVYFSLEENII